jgi:hypothetical protein
MSFAEQRWIVAKVDELMSCGELTIDLSLCIVVGRLEGGGNGGEEPGERSVRVDGTGGREQQEKNKWQPTLHRVR